MDQVNKDENPFNKIIVISLVYTSLTLLIGWPLLKLVGLRKLDNMSYAKSVMVLFLSIFLTHFITQYNSNMKRWMKNQYCKN